MKLHFLLFLGAFSLSAGAAPTRTAKSSKVTLGTNHQVTFGSTFTSAAATTRTSAGLAKGSALKTYVTGDADLTVNYAYKVSPRIQLGFLASYYADGDETKFKDGTESASKSSELKLYGFLTYNFSEALTSSYYLTGLLGKEQSSSSTQETGSPTEKSDDDLTGVGLVFGKRFSLRGLGIFNLTYSPSIGIKRSLVGGDLSSDSKIDTLDSINLDVLKFDLLF